MIIKNNLKKDFSITPNAIILDQSISAEALRVYMYIATKPETWTVRHTDIQAMLKINSRTSMTKYATELLNAGWVTRTLRHGESGSFNGGYDYELHSSKQPVKIDTDAPKNGRTDAPKNGRTDAPKNGRTDAPKNGHGVRPKNALSQNMDTSNTEIDRVIDNKVSNTKNTNKQPTVASVDDFDVSMFNTEETEAIKRWVDFRLVTYNLKKTTQALKVVINNLKIAKESGRNLPVMIDYFINNTMMQNINATNIEVVLKQVKAANKND